MRALLLLVLCVAGAAAAGGAWRCPATSAECRCDVPHTLRCAGEGAAALRAAGDALRGSGAPVSLLDVRVGGGAERLPEPLLAGASLHGLVLSSGGALRHLGARAFARLAAPLQALGLPDNALDAVPRDALAPLALLERLDLSHNRIRDIDDSAFKGLSNLSFLELSDNRLTTISPNTFASLPALQTLRLRGNKLTIPVISALRGLKVIQELDLSDNMLAGPLGPKTLPPLPSLSVLQLARNQLSSIRRDALSDFRSLTSLMLHHNQIDVLEDHAFRRLGNIVQLNLAHNRIVAVSGASLAHLVHLTQLDLSHNFLRSLTADLISPLKNLLELRLDDNDISIVSSSALTPEVKLQHLTLSDNPLNCDCQIAAFVFWLTNSSSLSPQDKATAVCATPPSLENGLLIQVSLDDLVCGEDEEEDDEDMDSGAPSEGPLSAPLPPSSSKATLQVFHYDGVNIVLTWVIDSNAIPYTCHSLVVYEERGVHEILLENISLECNSSQLLDPTSLSIPLPEIELEVGHNYRYCLLLLDGGGVSSDELLIEWGCSEIIPLVPALKPFRTTSNLPLLISGIKANVSAAGVLTVRALVWDQQVHNSGCIVTIGVYADGSLKRKEHVNCSHPTVMFSGFADGSYEVCAVVGEFSLTGPNGQCTTVSAAHWTPNVQRLVIAIVAAVGVICTTLAVAVCAKRLLRPKNLHHNHHQCYHASPQDDEQHAQYVKLQATTKV